MANTRRARPATTEKRQRILDSTEEIILERGYAAVTSRSVAERVGIQPPHLHYYFKTIDDLLAYANANPGKLSSSSGGVGQSSHLSLELFKSISGVDIVHVPYNGAAPSRMDLAAGRVDMTIDNLSTYLPDIEAGTLAVLASGTPQRSKFLPDVPTLREVGLEDYSATAWYALAAPAATPDETINQIYAKVDEILSDPEVVARIDALRAEVVDGTPAETDAFFAEEREKWSAVIERAGIGAQ